LSQVVAILCSDIHLSHRPPGFRSQEVSWYKAMKRPLDEVRALAEKHQCPILCGGDVIDSWKEPAELVNWAIKNLPPIYSVAGNHDTPHHRLDDLHRSAYWTLVEAGVIRNLAPGRPVEVGSIAIHGFPHGVDPKPLNKKDQHSLALHVAVVHKYVWTKDTGFERAPEDARLRNVLKDLDGYDAVLFGDNHKGFLAGKVFNAGTFYRRKSDEYHYRPCVGLLDFNGKITRHYLDCSQDKYAVFLREGPEKPDNRTGIEAGEYLEALKDLSGSKVDFEHTLKEELIRRKATTEIRRICKEAMEKGRLS